MPAPIAPSRLPEQYAAFIAQLKYEPSLKVKRGQKIVFDETFALYYEGKGGCTVHFGESQLLSSHQLLPVPSDPTEEGSVFGKVVIRRAGGIGYHLYVLKATANEIQYVIKRHDD